MLKYKILTIAVALLTFTGCVFSNPEEEKEQNVNTISDAQEEIIEINDNAEKSTKSLVFDPVSIKTNRFEDDEDWTNYTDENIGIGFKYPSSWGNIKIRKPEYGRNGSTYHITFENAEVSLKATTADYIIHQAPAPFYTQWKEYESAMDACNSFANKTLVSKGCQRREDGFVDLNYVSYIEPEMFGSGDSMSFAKRIFVPLSNDVYVGLTVSITMGEVIHPSFVNESRDTLVNKANGFMYNTFQKIDMAVIDEFLNSFTGVKEDKEVYTNDEYGFSVSYPLHKVVKEKGVTNFQFYTVDYLHEFNVRLHGDNKLSVMFIGILEDANVLTQLLSRIKDYQFNTITVDDVVAHEYIFYTGMGDDGEYNTRIITINLDDHVMFIEQTYYNVNKEIDEIFDSILETVQIL